MYFINGCCSALRIVLGSFYADELEIDAKQVLAVLATASMFNLNPVIKKCAEIMIESINFKVRKLL